MTTQTVMQWASKGLNVAVHAGFVVVYREGRSWRWTFYGIHSGALAREVRSRSTRRAAEACAVLTLGIERIGYPAKAVRPHPWGGWLELPNVNVNSKPFPDLFIPVLN